MTPKERLWMNIKLVGTFYGEPLPELQEYAKEVYSAWEGDLKKAIECFEDLLRQTKWSNYQHAKK
jgi:hypothetical protein